MSSPSRRQFIRTTAIGTGLLGVLPLTGIANELPPADDRPNVIGPREGGGCFTKLLYLKFGGK